MASTRDWSQRKFERGGSNKGWTRRGNGIFGGMGVWMESELAQSGTEMSGV